MEKTRNGLLAGSLYGNTDEAGCVPDGLAPSEGPVYLEGRLVLSLSFQPFGSAVAQMCGMGFASAYEFDVLRAAPPRRPDGALERYRIWDDLAEGWYPCSLELLRYEDEDVVVEECEGDACALLWRGPVDTRARIIAVPDLDDVGAAANEAHDLRWKRVG